MTFIQALVLGIVQGATEFLPISSSGHLVLVPWLLRWQIDPELAFVFDILVQWGTLLAVVFYFRDDLRTLIYAARSGIRSGQPLRDSDSRIAWLILVASIPATVIGLTLKDQVMQAFNSPQVTSIFLLLTALMLLASERLGKRERSLDTISVADAVWIGFAQALALFPGVSRSGATIAGGMTRRLKRPHAARFSFLIAIPVMIGAGVVAVLELINIPDGHNHVPVLLVGFFAAIIVGYFSIQWLLRYLTQRSLSKFAIYCAGAGVLGLLMSVIHG